MKKPTYDVTVRYGVPGHEDEYIILIDGFNLDQFIPMVISDGLEENLREVGYDFDWVMNRGSRIEVRTEDQSEQLHAYLQTTTELELVKDGFR